MLLQSGFVAFLACVCVLIKSRDIFFCLCIIQKVGWKNKKQKKHACE